MKKYCILLMCCVLCFLTACTGNQPLPQIDDAVTAFAKTSPTEVERQFKESLYDYFKSRPYETGALLKTIPLSEGAITNDQAMELAVGTLRDKVEKQLQRSEITQAEYDTKMQNFTIEEINTATEQSFAMRVSDYNTSLTSLLDNGDLEADLISYDTNYRMNTKSISENTDGSLTAQIDVQIVDEDSEWNDSAIDILPDSECEHRYITVNFIYNNTSSTGMYLTYVSVKEQNKKFD